MMILDEMNNLTRLAHGRDGLTTTEAATYLNRRPQTLRKWAAYDNGPIRPIRVNGRLLWPVPDIRRMLQCADHKPKSTFTPPLDSDIDHHDNRGDAGGDQ
jgi:hypothetical protein